MQIMWIATLELTKLELVVFYMTSMSLLVDSLDSMAGIVKNDGEIIGCALEAKTLTTLKTIYKALMLIEEHGKYVKVKNSFQSSGGVGCGLFRALVVSPEQRCQCLHHAACLKVQAVFYVVGASGSAELGVYCT